MQDEINRLIGLVYKLQNELELAKIRKDNYRQALDEIEQNIKDYCKNMCMTETRETCEICQNTEVLNIINKVKVGG